MLKINVGNCSNSYFQINGIPNNIAKGDIIDNEAEAKKVRDLFFKNLPISTYRALCHLLKEDMENYPILFN